MALSGRNGSIILWVVTGKDLRGAMHVPLSKKSVRDCMPVLFELIAAEPYASVRAVLGHFFFVYIHPYMDGYGRLGRFLMNAMMDTGGYMWTVIPLAQAAARPYGTKTTLMWSSYLPNSM